MTRKITIQDISRLAGTSPSTVSRVLTGSANVSPQKREAVERAIQRLNYRPSHIARSLKTNRTYSVGLLLNDITNPFYSAIARGVEERANQHGYSLILCNTNEDPERELQYLRVLIDKQVDGIILGPTGANSEYISDLASRTPVVQVDRQLYGMKSAAVLVDNEEGAYRVTHMLAEKGHRQIAIVKWNRNITTMQQRLAGYERALREHNLPLDPGLVISVPMLGPDAAAEETRKVLQSRPGPTAIFALNNQLGLGVLKAIQQSGLHIPADIAVVIFDNLDWFALVTPSISTVSQPAFDIGQRAMSLLAQQMGDPEHFCPEVIVLKTEFIARDSV